MSIILSSLLAGLFLPAKKNDAQLQARQQAAVDVAFSRGHDMQEWDGGTSQCSRCQAYLTTTRDRSGGGLVDGPALYNGCKD